MRRSSFLAFLAACAGLLPGAIAQIQVRAERQAVRDVRLSFADDAPRHTIVLRHGRIERILPLEAEPPPGARVLDGKGHVAVPAFIDAYSRTGLAERRHTADQDVPVDVIGDVQVDMRDANRKGIHPSYAAVRALAISKEAAAAWRKAGFGAALVAPGGELLAGTSVLVSTRSSPVRDVVLVPEVFAHGGFRASGPGYPGTLMAYFAQLRQFFLDARRQQELVRRFQMGLPDPRPPFDLELEAAAPLLRRQHRLVCDAESHRDIERWIHLADELALDIAIAGGRDAWRLADVLAERRIPVILTLDWGDEVKDPRKEKDKDKDKGKGAAKGEAQGSKPGEGKPDAATANKASADAPAPSDQAPPARGQAVARGPRADAPGKEAKPPTEYEEPFDLRVERRLRWEERRDAAMRLHEHGVTFAFGSGEAKPDDLLKRVRSLVESGLPADVARDALTASAARLLAMESRLGAVRAGRDATFALWTADPMQEDAQLAWLFVDGEGHEFELKDAKKRGKAAAGEGPAQGVDATGTWVLTYRRPRSDADSEATAELEMAADGSVTGSLSVTNPGQEGATRSDVTGMVFGKTLTLESTLTFGEFEMEVEIEAEIDGDALTGEIRFQGRFGERSASLTGERRPSQAAAATGGAEAHDACCGHETDEVEEPR